MSVTFTLERQIAEGKFYREGVCLSDDTKPTTDTTLSNGSLLLEMDTATPYFFDEDNAEWRAWQ